MTKTDTVDVAPETQISRAVAALMREITGRGAANVRTTLGNDFALVVLEEILTVQERALIGHGFAADVHSTRSAIQEILEGRASVIVERATGRAVRAFMSANHLGEDICAELFLLEPAGSRGDRSV